MTQRRKPRKRLTAEQLLQAQSQLGTRSPTISFDLRELRAIRLHANWLAQRVVVLEQVLNKDVRFSKRIVRKILALAGEVELL